MATGDPAAACGPALLADTPADRRPEQVRRDRREFVRTHHPTVAATQPRSATGSSTSMSCFAPPRLSASQAKDLPSPTVGGR